LRRCQPATQTLPGGLKKCPCCGKSNQQIDAVAFFRPFREILCPAEPGLRSQTRLALAVIVRAFSPMTGTNLRFNNFLRAFHEDYSLLQIFIGV